MLRFLFALILALSPLRALAQQANLVSVIEQRLRAQLGDLVFANIALQARVEDLQRQIDQERAARETERKSDAPPPQ